MFYFIQIAAHPTRNPTNCNCWITKNLLDFRHIWDQWKCLFFLYTWNPVIWTLEPLHLLKCEGKFDFSPPVLSGQGAVLWDGWRPRAGPVRGAPKRSFQQFRRQRLRLAVPGGAVRPLPVSAPGRCHAGSAPNAAAEPGPPHRQGTSVPTLMMQHVAFQRAGSFEFGRRLCRATPALMSLCLRACWCFVIRLVEEKMCPLISRDPRCLSSGQPKPANHHSQMHLFECPPCEDVWNREDTGLMWQQPDLSLYKMQIGRVSGVTFGMRTRCIPKVAPHFCINLCLYISVWTDGWLLFRLSGGRWAGVSVSRGPVNWSPTIKSKKKGRRKQTKSRQPPASTHNENQHIQG